MLTLEDIEALEACTNTSWGRSSTEVVSTSSFKFKLLGTDAAKLVYATIVTFHGQLTNADQSRELEIAEKHIDNYVSELRKQFKKETGRAIQLKVVELIPAVEVIDINTFSSLQAVRTAYFRCTAIIDVG